jgi:F0F1-type ATP synthase membrane subunit b/b'
MDIFALLDVIEDMVERGFTIPIWGKTLVEKEDVIDVLKEIRLKIPDEIKQAKWVKEERQKILHEAQIEANNMLKEAEEHILQKVSEHEICKEAQKKGEEIVNDAQDMAKEMHESAKHYADQVLCRLEDILKEAHGTISQNRSQLK